MQENRYLRRVESNLEKQASLTLAAIGAGKLLAHGTAVHAAQNLALQKALHTKALGSHLAKGFSEGVKGVHDVSLGAKAKQALIGATLPEINSMYHASHSAGKAMAPHLDKLSPRQKVALRQAVSGKTDKLLARGLHETPEFQAAYGEARRRMPGLPDLSDTKKAAGEISKFRDRVKTESNSPILNKLLPRIAKGDKLTKGEFVAGAPSAKSGLLGGVALAAADPLTSAINVGKGILNTSKFSASKVGQKVNHFFHDSMVTKPFRAGLEHADKTFSGIKDKAMATFVNPIPVEMSRLGSSVSRVSGEPGQKALAAASTEPQKHLLGQVSSAGKRLP